MRPELFIKVMRPESFIAVPAATTYFNSRLPFIFLCAGVLRLQKSYTSSRRGEHPLVLRPSRART